MGPEQPGPVTCLPEAAGESVPAGCGCVSDRPRVRLRAVLILLAFAGMEARGADWVVTGAEVRAGIPISLDGSLVVERGGSLTLRGVTLTLNNASHGQHGIRVKSGGALTIEANSVITTASNDARMYFAVEDGASLVMRSSELRRCGWAETSGYELPGQERGLVVRGSVTLESSTFTEFSMITLTSPGSGGTIVGNSFRCDGHAEGHLFILTRSGLTITGNSFGPNEWFGVSLYISHNNVIRENTFDGIAHGALALRQAWNNEFANNTVRGGAGPYLMRRSGGTRIVNNTFDGGAEGISVFNSDYNTIQGNTITTRSHWGLLLSYASHNLVADNTFGGYVEVKTQAVVELIHASDNRILNNRITQPPIEAGAFVGVLLWQSSCDNTVQGNTITGARRGLSVHYASNGNTLSRNHVEGSLEQALVVEESESNTLVLNNIVGAGRPPMDDTGRNAWDDGSSGNYWSEYTGSGTPYPIPPAGADRRPLAAPVVLAGVPATPLTPRPIPADPSRPDWDIVSDVVIDGRTVRADDFGTVRVKAGGRLTLRDASLLLDGDLTALLVESGGALQIERSTIAPMEGGRGGFTFQVFEGASLVMRDSVVRGAGGHPGWGDGVSTGAANVVLENNRIEDAVGGIIAGGDGFTVVGNEVSHCEHGISLTGAESAASGGTIAGNRVSRCLWTGIDAHGIPRVRVTQNWVSHIWGAAIDVGADSTVEGNTVALAGKGLNTADRCEVRGNAFSDIFGWALENWGRECRVTGNSFASSGGGVFSRYNSSTYCSNSFIHNTVQASTIDPGDVWSCNGRGNYWSDYTGVDANGDGIGDTPYPIQNHVQDDYPLMAPAQKSSISGRAATASGAPIAGVVLRGVPGNPSTDAKGYYAASVDWGFSGTLTPSKAGYAFAPPGTTYTNLKTNPIDQDYTGLAVLNVLSTVSAASFLPGVPLAPAVIAAGFGENLAPTTELAPGGLPLPTVLAGTSVSVRDSAGTERLAGLWFVSPTQINYLVPDATATGLAMVTVARQAETVAQGTLQIDTTAPGIFTANCDGRGVPAAQAIRVREDTSQSWWYVHSSGCTPGNCVPAPIDLGPETDQIFLVLYGTGIRGRSGLSAVTATIGGVNAPVDYAGPTAGFVGLDQVNLRVPRSLAGRGQVDILLTVDGRRANVFTVNIQ